MQCVPQLQLAFASSIREAYGREASTRVQRNWLSVQVPCGDRKLVEIAEADRRETIKQAAESDAVKPSHIFDFIVHCYWF